MRSIVITFWLLLVASTAHAQYVNDYSGSYRITPSIGGGFTATYAPPPAYIPPARPIYQAPRPSYVPHSYFVPEGRVDVGRINQMLGR